MNAIKILFKQLRAGVDTAYTPGLLSFLWCELNVSLIYLGDSHAERHAFKAAFCLNVLEQAGSLGAV